MKQYLFILFALFILIAGCSSGDDQATSNQPSDDHFLKDQMQAFEKAKDVEQMIQSGADKRQQAMEEQGR